MMTYRFKFTKGPQVKFIGHLDVMQTFQRTIKRANLPIAYSQGFNPHQLLSFASPLSLGYTSEGEYGDFKLTQPMDTKELMERLNNTMPNGMVIKEIIPLKENTKNTMASLEGGRYMAFFDETITPQLIENNLEKYLQQEEIVVMKKTKKNFKETDIKPDIFWVKNASTDNQAAIDMFVSCGSKRNLKPESVAEGFCNFVNVPYNKFRIGFKRMDLFMLNENNEFVTLTTGVEAE